MIHTLLFNSLVHTHALALPHSPSFCPIHAWIHPWLHPPDIDHIDPSLVKSTNREMPRNLGYNWIANMDVFYFSKTILYLEMLPQK